MGNSSWKALGCVAVMLLVMGMTFATSLSPVRAAGNHTLYFPLIRRPLPTPTPTRTPTPPSDPLTVNPQDRAASLEFYRRVYLASEGTVIGWTGNQADCNAGTTAAAFRDAVTLRINYYRAMAGVPPLNGQSPAYVRKAQQAALMQSVNRSLNHDPPTSWQCYTAEGDEASRRSNLCLGRNGPAAIDGYMADPGSNNTPAGHRRWILYPQTRVMGSGDVAATSGYMAANALWAWDDRFGDPRPPTREEYVAWPPPGYTPHRVVSPRWSFAYAGADLRTATVDVRRNGQNVGVTVHPVANGYGENTLVWDVDADLSPGPDTAYDVTVRDVRIGGVARDFAYRVIVFNAD